MYGQQTRTQVIIYDISNDDKKIFVAAGLTIKSDKDRHSKQLAQKYAVRHALDNFKIDKVIKGLIWKDFFQNSKGTNKLKGANNETK